jgi:hypothetical protein
MIKKIGFFVVMAAIIAAFGGCQKEELTVRQLTDEEVQPQEVVQPDVFVENEYLAFKNIEAVDSIIHLLNKMTTSEKETWENQLGFKSARAEFDALFEEDDKLPTLEAFLAFKEKYKDKLIFNDNDPDDCSIDYPYATKFFLPILNNEGVFKVGEIFYKYTKDNQYIIADGDLKKLKNLDEYISDDMVITVPRLKSATPLHTFPEDDPSENNNEFHRKPNIDQRKIKHELFIDLYINKIQTGLWKRGYYVVVNQRGQKLSWGSWRDYKTVYSMRKIKCEIGSVIYIEDTNTHYSAEVKPSANFTLGHHFDVVTWPDPYLPPFLSIPNIKYSAEVTFRGFGFDNDDYYVIDIPENYGTASTDLYPPWSGY